MNGMIELSVGTEKSFKIELAKRFLGKEFSDQDINVSAQATESGVSETPFSQEETELGARNRSRKALDAKPNAHFGIGMEGGIFEEKGNLHLVEKAAISINMGNGNYLTQSGTSEDIVLPPEMKSFLSEGKPFNQVTQDYLKSKGIKVPIGEIKKNGSAFYCTRLQITRNEMMTQALTNAMQKLDEELETRKS